MTDDLPGELERELLASNPSLGTQIDARKLSALLAEERQAREKAERACPHCGCDPDEHGGGR